MITEDLPGALGSCGARAEALRPLAAPRPPWGGAARGWRGRVRILRLSATVWGRRGRRDGLNSGPVRSVRRLSRELRVEEEGGDKGPRGGCISLTGPAVGPGRRPAEEERLPGPGRPVLGPSGSWRAECVPTSPRSSAQQRGSAAEPVR